MRDASVQTVAAGAPGVTAVIRGPSGVERYAVGLGDVRRGTWISSFDAARVGSVTKAFTATVVLQLAGQGNLPGWTPNVEMGWNEWELKSASDSPANGMAVCPSDRPRRCAYANLSPRTDAVAIADFDDRLDYSTFVFDARDRSVGEPAARCHPTKPHGRPGGWPGVKGWGTGKASRVSPGPPTFIPISPPLYSSPLSAPRPACPGRRRTGTAYERQCLGHHPRL